MPSILLSPSPVEFVDAGDLIRMRYTQWGVERLVYMRPGGAPIQPHSPHGTSFGRWEGRTLAIFTTYIEEGTAANAGVAQTRDLTVLERYAADPASGRLEWQVTVTDPALREEPLRLEGYHSAGAVSVAAGPGCGDSDNNKGNIE